MTTAVTKRLLEILNLAEESGMLYLAEEFGINIELVDKRGTLRTSLRYHSQQVMRRRVSKMVTFGNERSLFQVQMITLTWLRLPGYLKSTEASETEMQGQWIRSRRSHTSLQTRNMLVLRETLSEIVMQ